MDSGTIMLRVIRGEDRGKAWELDPRQIYLLGRSRRCNLRLADGAASASHARVECKHGIWFVTDVQSTHGTHVNRQRILDAKPLFDRDLIQVGRTLLEFREHEQLAPADLDEIGRGVHLLE